MATVDKLPGPITPKKMEEGGHSMASSRRDPNEFLLGFPYWSQRISQEPLSQIFRRFNDSSARDLLYLEAKVMALRQDQERRNLEDSKIVDEAADKTRGLASLIEAVKMAGHEEAVNILGITRFDLRFEFYREAARSWESYAASSIPVFKYAWQYDLLGASGLGDRLGSILEGVAEELAIPEWQLQGWAIKRDLDLVRLYTGKWSALYALLVHRRLKFDLERAIRAFSMFIKSLLRTALEQIVGYTLGKTTQQAVQTEKRGKSSLSQEVSPYVRQRFRSIALNLDEAGEDHSRDLPKEDTEHLEGEFNNIVSLLRREEKVGARDDDRAMYIMASRTNDFLDRIVGIPREHLGGYLEETVKHLKHVTQVGVLLAECLSRRYKEDAPEWLWSADERIVQGFEFWRKHFDDELHFLQSKVVAWCQETTYSGEEKERELRRREKRPDVIKTLWEALWENTSEPPLPATINDDYFEDLAQEFRKRQKLDRLAHKCLQEYRMSIA